MPVRLLLANLPPVFAAAALAGCSSYSAPTLRVSEAHVIERSPSASVVHFTIEAQNANDVELPLRAVSYTLSRDGQAVFRGLRSPEATLRRIGTQTFTIPAVLPSTEPARAEVYTLEGTLEYIVPGSLAQVLFDTGVRRPSVAFSQDVRIDPTLPASADAPSTTPQP